MRMMPGRWSLCDGRIVPVDEEAKAAYEKERDIDDWPTGRYFAAWEPE